MRRPLPYLVLLLTTAACSQGGIPDNSSVSGPASNAAADAGVAEFETTPGRATRETGPAVNPANAPGVAFNYRYSFRLDAAHVAQVQQEHQRICERYTIARCRITGMVYRATSEDDVEAMLAFRVDPAIAGQFGREGVQAVTAAEGMLADSEISGTDVGAPLQANNRDLQRLEADLARIQAQLGRRGLPSEERSRLEYDAQMLRQQIADLRGTRDAQQQSLATTPILFRYGSGSLAPGFAQPPSLKHALADTADDFLYSLNLLLVVLVRLLPWGVAALLGWLVVRFARRRLLPKPVADAEAAA
ncbi:MAG: hypothetical protein QOG13_1799 [Sphingomonadales bacterium]|jgi:hypothetical protein|nr:hypothetical protein [Sphingomonadales bacterium]MEA3045228.1 hypothetical protein [Sphingomonadales bacterium]